MESFFAPSLNLSSPFPVTAPSSSVRNEPDKTSNRRHHQYWPSTSTTPPTAVAAAVHGTSVPAVILNAADQFINDFIDPPLRPSADPKLSLSDNFAPVDELPPTECEVAKGPLPPCLDGAYIRNGPNPQFLPRGPYHLFDGDGMLHALRISGGRATLCSRYVKTNKYAAEREAASPVMPNVFSGFHGIPAAAARGALFAARVLAGQFNPGNGIGLANTSVALLGGRLFALGESDVPYEIRFRSDGDVETVGRQTFGGKLLGNMTAHPKIDPDTGEAFAFRVGPIPPFLTYFRFSAGGAKEPDVPISLRSPSFLHDFAITRRYAIFTDTQLGMVLNPGGSMVGADSRKVPRIGIIPRYARDESEMRWFDVPGFNNVHAINAWDDEEEGGTVTMVAPNILSVEHTLERMELTYPSVEVVKVEMRTGRVWRRPVSARNLEFAVINPAYVGKKNRYVYAAVGDPMPKITGVVKLDLAAQGECTAASRMYGEGCYGGEPFFVAREPENAEAAEDDGYVVSYVHDERAGESRFVVMDARSPQLDVVAAVKLPRRVPYGFHGLFVRDAHLNIR